MLDDAITPPPRSCSKRCVQRAKRALGLARATVRRPGGDRRVDVSPSRGAAWLERRRHRALAAGGSLFDATSGCCSTSRRRPTAYALVRRACDSTDPRCGAGHGGVRTIPCRRHHHRTERTRAAPRRRRSRTRHTDGTCGICAGGDRGKPPPRRMGQSFRPARQSATYHDRRSFGELYVLSSIAGSRSRAKAVWCLSTTLSGRCSTAAS